MRIILISPLPLTIFSFRRVVRWTLRYVRHIMVIRAQIFKKNAQIFFFHAQVKMLIFKIMVRLKCSDENKCSDKNAQMKINAQMKMLTSKKSSDEND